MAARVLCFGFEDVVTGCGADANISTRLMRSSHVIFRESTFCFHRISLQDTRAYCYMSLLLQFNGVGLPECGLLPTLRIAPSARALTTMYSISLLRASRQATCALRPAPAAAPQFARSSFARAFSSSTLRREAPKPTDGEQALKAKLEEKLQGAKVDVQDVSGASPLPLSLRPTFRGRLTISPGSVRCGTSWDTGGCGSFYAISVEHESFKGLTMIKQHRLVNDLLKDDIKDMHGLQVGPLPTLDWEVRNPDCHWLTDDPSLTAAQDQGAVSRTRNALSPKSTGGLSSSPRSLLLYLPMPSPPASHRNSPRYQPESRSRGLSGPDGPRQTCFGAGGGIALSRARASVLVGFSSSVCSTRPCV